MSTLNARGHEVLDTTPLERAVQVKTRSSVFDMIHAELRRAQLAASEEIKDEEDLYEDQTDFEDDSFFTSGPEGGPYEVPDDVPDRIYPPEKKKEEKTVPNVSETEKEPQTGAETA
uniref:Uncharacterized protein n=1 Tax=Dulem virus 92 TaxID=3145803 RepID=A0AAU8B9U2_9VIRU